MGTWKDSAKQDGVRNEGPAGVQKRPMAGVMPGSGGVSSQENPRRQRRQDYTPSPQPRERGVRHS